MKPIYINMPVGDYYGWAICGKNILLELDKMASVKYIVNGYEYGFRSDALLDKILSLETVVDKDLDVPFIHTINNDFKGGFPYRGKPNVGYIFYEKDVIPREDVSFLNKHFDVVVAGSTWNSEVLEEGGVKNVRTIFQGVDCKIFLPREKTIWKDQFVIFSSGKFEHRKAQDIVIDAVSEMQKRHKDVCLVALWNNLFSPDEFKKYIEFNGHKLDKERTMLLPIVSQDKLAKIMNSTDIGVFPNRVEGGTNLVLMEYLACGKPVIANNSTGQRDVLTTAYNYYVDSNNLLDNTIELLEYAYYNRGALVDMGKEARKAMEPFTWEKTARQFYEACYAECKEGG